jgi:hypothetical protein
MWPTVARGTHVGDTVKVSEDGLRQRVVIPLFRGMAYQDVQDHHGGSSEQGEDFAIWESDDFPPRADSGQPDTT